MRTLFASICLTLALGAGASFGQITFDDLSGVPPTVVGIPDGYGGLDWTNLYPVSSVWAASVFGPNGYTNGVISPDNLAENGFGNPASITSQTPFTFNSGFFTAAFDDNLTLNLVGKLQGNTVFATTLTLNPLTPTHVIENWSGLDELDLSTSGGTPHWGVAVNDKEFGLDNLTIDATPEPSTFALLILSGTIAAWRHRKPGNKSRK